MSPQSTRYVHLMLIMKQITLLVNESMPEDSKKIVKPQKETKNFIQNYENSESKPKKNMSNSLKTMFFVHWASFECKRGLPLIEPQYKK